MKENSTLLLLGLVVFLGVFGFSNGSGLVMNFYSTTCPNAEKILRNITWALTAAEPDTAADLLRLHYHDCFVRGCDGSILLDTAGGEKEAGPNQSLGSGGFEAVDQIKTRLEQECPGIVSCSDILALAARDAVSFKFKRSMWDVFTGRRDGIVSLSSETTNNLPSPFSNFNTLRQLFARKNLNVLDLVALSGAHTIGTAHCSAFNRRLYNFTGNNDSDPSLNPTYANVLRSQCTNPPNPTTTVEMDQDSSLDFDTDYFVGLSQKKGLFQSDAALLTNFFAATLVKLFQTETVFFRLFGFSMTKMGDIEVLVGATGQIRKQCRAINIP